MARNAALAVLTLVLALVDLGLAAIGLLVLSAQHHGHLSSGEAVSFSVAGISALGGAVVLILTAVALARRAAEGARFARGLAWLRLVAVIAALGAAVVLGGHTALTGFFQVLGAIVALLDAFMLIAVTRVAVRRTMP